MEPSKFWVVWSPERGQSRVMHNGLKEAKEEALRLTEKELRPFYVLRSVGIVRLGLPEYCELR